MICVENIDKRYKANWVLWNVSLVVGRGEVLGLVGPNGAGKTTMLRILAGFLPCDRGRVSIGGYDVTCSSSVTRRLVGYLPQTAPAYSDMRVGEYLDFRARVKGLSRLRRKQQVISVLEQADLADKKPVIIGHLSQGYRQRLGLADALIGCPPVLILDEPTAGLDPVQLQRFRVLIASLAKKHTIIISSHSLVDIDAVATKLVLLAEGRVTAAGTPRELRQRSGLGADAPLESVFLALL